MKYYLTTYGVLMRFAQMYDTRKEAIDGLLGVIAKSIEDEKEYRLKLDPLSKWARFTLDQIAKSFKILKIEDKVKDASKTFTNKELMPIERAKPRKARKKNGKKSKVQKVQKGQQDG